MAFAFTLPLSVGVGVGIAIVIIAIVLIVTSHVRLALRGPRQPAELIQAFELKVTSANGKPETLVFSQGGDDWYAKSESSRGLVKLPRGSAKDAADDVADVLEGKAPIEEKSPDAPPTAPAAGNASSSTNERPSPLPMPPLGAKPPVPAQR